MIDRKRSRAELQAALNRAPVVLLTGPRQAGKSTLASQVVDPASDHRFDLEDPRDDARLGDPTLTLSHLEGTVVIDEAQRRPDLFPILRVLVDEDRRNGRFLVLGSASPDLVGLAAESLAGRVTLVELPGLDLADVGGERLDGLWLRGGLPPAFTAATDAASAAWREDYIRTFLERDLANLGVRTPATTMRRFWTMVAHYHGQTWNGAELARSLAVSQPTVRRYLDALTDALVLRQLQPWHTNLGKRQVRSPKVYVRDTGLLHRLLGIDDRHALLGHPKLGASWEGFVIEQLLARLGAPAAWFWGTHAGAEIDLVLHQRTERIGVEVKRTDSPRLTPSIRTAIGDLDLARVVVVHAGTDRYPLAADVEAIGAAELLTSGLPLSGPR
ncbi:MAG TPA: ATP-binding protein [Acidimicrobiales bacterium]|nr:ATP-binding protein [Acidimicrobiales bacterium]